MSLWTVMEGSAAGDLMGFVKAWVLVMKMKMVDRKVKVVVRRCDVCILSVRGFRLRSLLVDWSVEKLEMQFMAQFGWCSFAESWLSLYRIGICSL